MLQSYRNFVKKDETWIDINNEQLNRLANAIKSPHADIRIEQRDAKLIFDWFQQTAKNHGIDGIIRQGGSYTPGIHKTDQNRWFVLFHNLVLITTDNMKRIITAWKPTSFNDYKGIVRKSKHQIQKYENKKNEKKIKLQIKHKIQDKKNDLIREKARTRKFFMCT